MEKIESFKVDHTKLKRGMYISRTDAGVVTYDVRTRVPNTEPVMENAAIHTIEHLFATYVRSSELKGNIIYFGPMGCRTGFYFLTTGISHAQALELTVRAFGFIAGYEGEIPGATAVECGNYREHDLAGAKREAREQHGILKGWTAEMLNYQ